MKNNTAITISKGDVSKSAWTYVFFHHSAQNYERMMGLAFAHTLQQPLRKLYPNDEEYSLALKRHMQYFNSEPTLGAVIPGVILALEEGRANGEEVNEELIISTKTALMGPLAGIGDSLIGSVYGTIVASIAIGLSIESGSLIGPVMYMIFSAGVLVALKYGLFMKGYQLGLGAIKFLTSELTDVLTMALSVIGLVTVGGITANTVQAPVKWEYVSGDLVISLQEILDKIMPGLIPLTLTIGIWYLYSKKNWSTVKTLLVLLASVFVLVFFGIM